MKLVLCLASLLLSLSAVSAEKLYYTVVYGNGVTTTVQNQIASGETTLLASLDSATPSTMSVCGSGETFTQETYSTTGGTTTDNSVRKLFPTKRDLQVSTCPSKCRTSGSTYCRSLGCAYCSNCRRNLRSLVSTSTTSIASSIKTELDSDLASYCNGVSGCQLWTKVYEVNPDGTLTEVA
jgi:hypothetical protein